MGLIVEVKETLMKMSLVSGHRTVHSVRMPEIKPENDNDDAAAVTENQKKESLPEVCGSGVIITSQSPGTG
jgi:hypothetical protein